MSLAGCRLQKGPTAATVAGGLSAESRPLCLDGRNQEGRAASGWVSQRLSQ